MQKLLVTPALCIFLLLPLLMSALANAITINIEYASGTLFHPSADGTAKAAINAAAADISAAITTSLDAITADVYTGTNGSSTASFDWKFTYTDPSNSSPRTIDPITTAADTVTIFVGAHPLTNNTLGRGGPAGIGVLISASGVPSESPDAVEHGAELSQAALLRGGGPTIGAILGDWDWAGHTKSYTVDYGVSYGSMAFDNDSNNNGTVDSASQLNGYWHWDHSSSVSAGKNDLYSVALHEILHALGVGASRSWDDLTNGTTWNGAEVQALTNGNGFNLVDSGGDHIASSLMSTRISDGSSQEVVMDPTVTQGQRKELTALDLAFLRDIGYETITPATGPTDPADFDGDNDVDAADLLAWQAAYSSNNNGDTDNDNDTDGNDFLAWQRQYTGTNPSFSAVPEPTSAGLLMLGMLLLAGCRKN